MNREKAERKLRKLEAKRLDLLRFIYGTAIDSVENGDVFRSELNGGDYTAVVDAYGYVNFISSDHSGYYQQNALPAPVMKDHAVEWLIKNACHRVHV